jgi:hypothetical protein
MGNDGYAPDEIRNPITGISFVSYNNDSKRHHGFFSRPGRFLRNRPSLGFVVGEGIGITEISLV